jgi:ribosomal protein S18 acetylase RimI-like enzyme
LLRATPALDRGRLNSALPLVPDPPGGLAAVEAFYAERSLPAQIQVTPLDGHPALTAELDRRGWGAKWPTVVMSATATAIGAGHTAVEILPAPTPAFRAAWAGAEPRDPADVDAHAREVLARLDGRAAYAVAADGAGTGIVVAAGELAGLFSIAVAPRNRRRGLGTELVRALAAHAHDRGAKELYLEVEERNAAAIALYARLGFTPRYRYVHRIAPVPPR